LETLFQEYRLVISLGLDALLIAVFHATVARAETSNIAKEEESLELMEVSGANTEGFRATR